MLIRMVEDVEHFSLEVESTSKFCPTGQIIGKRNLDEGKIPVLSCEGGCIRGEIARVAANIVAREEPYRRACHGEFFTVPDSEISNWMRGAGKVVLIDGCFMRCHERIMKNLIDDDRMVVFDALSHYNKYTDLFYIDDVPEEEWRPVAQDVADWVLSSLRNEGTF